MNDRFEQLKTAFQKLKGISSGRYKKQAAIAEAGVRASIAVSGVLLIIGSIGIAMGFSSNDSFRTALIAMVPFSIQEELPPAQVGVVAYGEIVSARELALSSRASGLIREIFVRPGELVEENAPIALVDDTEARRALRDAETTLASAELALSRVGSNVSRPATETARVDAGALSVAFDDAYIEMSQIFLSLPDIVSGLSGMLYGGGFSDGGLDYLIAQADRISADNSDIDEIRDRAANRYVIAKEKYQKAKDEYHRISSNSDDASIEALLINTQEAVGALSDATKGVNELFAFIQNHMRSLRYQPPLVFEEYEDALGSYSSQLNDQQGLLNGTVEYIGSQRAALSAGAPADSNINIDIERKEAELEVTRVRNLLADAQAKLEHYEIQAPFSGSIASIEKHKAEYVSDGEVVAKLIARDALALVTLTQNEAARITMGQAVRLSFEGFDIELGGKVVEIGRGEKGEDGIVRFTVTIALEKDDRIKPGMRVVARLFGG